MKKSMTDNNDVEREFDFRFILCDLVLIVIFSDCIDSFVFNIRNILCVFFFYIISTLIHKQLVGEYETLDSYLTELFSFAIFAIVLIGFGADANIVISAIISARLIEYFDRI